MKTRTINARQMLALLERARDERGADFVYDNQAAGTCVYVANEDRQGSLPGGVKDGEAACIVGKAIDLFDHSLLQRLDSDEADSANANEALGWLEKDGVVVSAYACYIARAVQECQDAGRTWGESVERGLKDTVGWAPSPSAIEAWLARDDSFAA